MKKIIIFILNFGIAGFAFGQYDYGNQWIDYTKSGKYFKFRVINESMYKITYDVLDSIVSSAGESMANIPGKKFNLYHAGKQVPLYVGDNNGVNPNILSSTDFIEFYAKMNDGVFDSNLYKQASWQNHHYTSMYNDTASYYLTWNVDTPVRIGYTVNNINPPLPPLEINHMDHVLKVDKYNLNYVRWGYNNGKPAYWSVSIPNFLPEFEEGEGRVGSNIPTLLNKNYVDYPNLFTTNVDTAGTVGQFTIKVVGKSKTGANPDHFMKVFINNVQIVDTTFDAYNVFEFTVNYDPKILQFNNKVRVEASNTGFANTIAVSYFEMKYPRPYNFFNYSKYSFAVTGTTSERYLEVDNFNARFTIPVLFDITNSLRIQGIWNASKSVWQFVLPVTGQVTSERKLFLTSQHSIDMIELKTKDFERKFFIDYTKLANQGNFIIISHPSLLDSSSGTNWVGAYKQLKSDYGDTVVVVMIDELYDQFSYGIDKHPLAVRNFINYAYDNWTIRPDNLFIIGFGLSNGEFYDYTYGPDYEMTLIPTFGTPPSDNLLVVRDNFTYTPLLGVGRLAARTPDEVRIYYEKARDYLL
ncbi:MAG: hypothetical protein IIA45_12395, partial [Bacteroidetes bacterium]|nr:hypothetical protein [Bacteroidota bacterium]